MAEPVTGRISLHPGREKPVQNRHPWIFSGAIATRQGEPNPGDLVDVVSSHGRFLARGFYNPHSQIQVRLLTWDANETIDNQFWEARLRHAINGRRALRQTSNACRLVFAEADGLPGLIVDQYDTYLVMQCLTQGMAARRDMIADLLMSIHRPTAIMERSDADVRQKEGLPPARGWLRGGPPDAPVVIREHGLAFQVDLAQGHKTGFYLDQRDNRALVGSLATGAEMLNIFAYTGGFAVHAAAAGAGPIVNVDSAIPALELAEANVLQNNPNRTDDSYIAADAFDYLRHLRDNGRVFDLIVLDPPKFAHSRQDVKQASRGYKDLNWLAFQLLRPGGMLATFSCSGLVNADLFQKIVFGAAQDAQRQAQIIRWLHQGPDHPVLLSFPESAYLKGLLCRVW